MELSTCWPQSGRGFLGCAMCSPMAPSCDSRSSAWASRRSRYQVFRQGQRVPTTAPPVDCRTNLRMARALPTARQGLGKVHRLVHPGPSLLQSACLRAEPKGTLIFEELLNRALTHRQLLFLFFGKVRQLSDPSKHELGKVFAGQVAAGPK